MKKAIRQIIAGVLVFGIGTGTVAASPTGSYLAQEQFNAQVLDLLKQHDLTGLKDLMDRVPDCVLPEQDEIIPEVCTNDRTDGYDFIRHIWKKGTKPGQVRLNIVDVDGGLYDSLRSLYWYLYQADPRNFHKEFYRDFYNRYKQTWLRAYIEVILTQLWQRGTTYEKLSGFSAMTGKHIYTTLYVSQQLGFDSIYQYISPGVRLDKYVNGGGRNWLRSILTEMKQASEETNTPELLRAVKTAWFTSILESEWYDEAERQYYQGIKQKRMFELLNEDGWAMFADLAPALPKWQRHNIGVYIRACGHLYSAAVCEAFENGAVKYGFYTPPVQYTEPTKEEMIEEIKTQLQEKLRGI